MKKPILILAHGSGQPSDSPWMDSLVSALLDNGVETVRFDFDYMSQSREAGKPRPPSALPKLVEEFRSIVQMWENTNTVFVGGKSLGGRVATHLAITDRVAGVVVFGYPFHPPGKPDSLRTEHLSCINCPVLICQGERDTFGRKEEVMGYGLGANVRLEWLPDGDHQFKPRKSSGTTQQENLTRAAVATAGFMGS